MRVGLWVVLVHAEERRTGVVLKWIVYIGEEEVTPRSDVNEVAALQTLITPLARAKMVHEKVMMFFNILVQKVSVKSLLIGSICSLHAKHYAKRRTR